MDETSETNKSTLQANKNTQEETVHIEDKEEKEISYYNKELERITKTIESLANLVANKSKTKVRNCRAKCPEKELKSKGIQVGEDDIKKEQKKRKLKIEEKIKDVLQKNGDFDSLKGIIDEKWPQDVYQVTEMEGASQNTIIDQQVDCAILIDPRNEDGNKILDKLVLKYDGLELIKGNEGLPYIFII